MIKKYFAVYDKVTKLFGDLFLGVNEETILRDLEVMIKKDELPHWVDKKLVEIGSFDYNTGLFVPVGNVENSGTELAIRFANILKNKKDAIASELKKEIDNKN